MSAHSRFEIRCRDLRGGEPRRRVASRVNFKTPEAAIEYAMEWARWHPQAVDIWVEEIVRKTVTMVREYGVEIP